MNNNFNQAFSFKKLEKRIGLFIRKIAVYKYPILNNIETFTSGYEGKLSLIKGKIQSTYITNEEKWFDDQSDFKQLYKYIPLSSKINSIKYACVENISSYSFTDNDNSFWFSELIPLIITVNNIANWCNDIYFALEKIMIKNKIQQFDNEIFFSEIKTIHELKKIIYLEICLGSFDNKVNNSFTNLVHYEHLIESSVKIVIDLILPMNFKYSIESWKYGSPTIVQLWKSMILNIGKIHYANILRFLFSECETTKNYIKFINYWKNEYYKYDYYEIDDNFIEKEIIVMKRNDQMFDDLINNYLINTENDTIETDINAHWQCQHCWNLIDSNKDLRNNYRNNPEYKNSHKFIPEFLKLCYEYFLSNKL